MEAKAINKLTMKNSIIYALLVAVAILSVPFIAMFFTTEVNWGPFDFAAIGLLVFSATLIYLLAARTIQSRYYKVALALLILAILGLTWVELAVGIFGTPFAGQ